jgi:hypothetical protein
MQIGTRWGMLGEGRGGRGIIQVRQLVVVVEIAFFSCEYL